MDEATEELWKYAHSNGMTLSYQNQTKNFLNIVSKKCSTFSIKKTGLQVNIHHARFSRDYDFRKEWSIGKF